MTGAAKNKRSQRLRTNVIGWTLTMKLSSRQISTRKQTLCPVCRFLTWEWSCECVAGFQLRPHLRLLWWNGHQNLLCTLLCQEPAWVWAEAPHREAWQVRNVQLKLSHDHELWCHGMVHALTVSWPFFCFWLLFMFRQSFNHGIVVYAMLPVRHYGLDCVSCILWLMQAAGRVWGWAVLHGTAPTGLL